MPYRLRHANLEELIKIKVNNLSLPEFIAYLIREKEDEMISDGAYFFDDLLCIKTAYETHTQYNIQFSNNPLLSFTVLVGEELDSRIMQEDVGFFKVRFNDIESGDETYYFEMQIIKRINKEVVIARLKFFKELLKIMNNCRRIINKRGNLAYLDSLIIDAGYTVQQGYRIIARAVDYYIKNH